MNQDARLQLVSEIVRAFAEATTDYDRLLEQIARRAAEVLRATCNLQILDPDGVTLRPAAVHATDPAVREGLQTLLRAEPLSLDNNANYRQALETGAPLLLQKIDRPLLARTTAPRHASFAESIGIHSALIVALRVRGRSIGSLSLARYDPGLPSFDESDRDLAQMLADHAALAISNARLLRAAAESEQNLATTLHSIGDGVITTDTHGRVERMNPVAEALTGWKLAEARGRPLPEVFRLRNDELIARDGSSRPIADSAAPIRDGDGPSRGVVRVFRDVTATREALELAAENRRVQEATRLKSEFLANMSHELRTPLNSVLGFGELLHEQIAGPLNEKQKEFVGHMLTSGKHLLQLINDVLDLSKVEAGKVEFRPEPVDLHDVLHEVTRILSATAASANVRLTTRVDDDLGEVILDPHRLKQVLYNFLSNALKFTPAGGTVEARIVAAGADGFRIEVEDTGIGIAPEDLPQLFVQFQQLDAGHAKKHPGTGLGLALTRRLVEAQGGEVGVASVPGEGSIFHATMPRRAARRRATVSAEQLLPKPLAPDDLVEVLDRLGVTPDRPGRIWIVDDDHSSMELMLHTLEPLGFDSVGFPSATAALAHLGEEIPVAVVLDLIMPEIDGFAFLDQFRRIEACRAVPVVVWTVKDLTEEEYARLHATAHVFRAAGHGQQGASDG